MRHWFASNLPHRSRVIGGDDWSITSTSHQFGNTTHRSRDYLRRSFFVRTLNFTIGRREVEATRVLLRRRRRSRRASVEKKCRASNPPAIKATMQRVTSAIGLPKFIKVYLAHDAGM